MCKFFPSITHWCWSKELWVYVLKLCNISAAIDYFGTKGDCEIVFGNKIPCKLKIIWNVMELNASRLKKPPFFTLLVFLFISLFLIRTWLWLVINSQDNSSFISSIKIRIKNKKQNKNGWRRKRKENLRSTMRSMPHRGERWQAQDRAESLRHVGPSNGRSPRIHLHRRE